METPSEENDVDVRGMAFALVRGGEPILSGSIPVLMPSRELAYLSYYKRMADSAKAELWMAPMKETKSDPEREFIIFGKTWETIQQMQEKRYRPTFVKSKIPDGAVLVYKSV